MNYHQSLQKLVKLCIDHGDPFLDSDHEHEFAKGVADSVRSAGPEAYSSFIELLSYLFACRNQWVGLSLIVTEQLPPSPPLNQLLQRIADASAMAPQPPHPAFRGERGGGGNVGWTEMRCNFIRNKAKSILADWRELTTTNAPQLDDIKFDCPQCSGSIAIERRGAGLLLACPHCSKEIRVPTECEAEG